MKPQNVFEPLSGKRLARCLGHCPARFQLLSIGTARAVASVPCTMPVSAPLAWTDTPDRPGWPGKAYPRNGRKKVRISAAKASGCSSAAKWPPRSMGVQRWMLNTRSAIERGGRTISRGKSM
jgi:hypothetical protein